MDSGTRKVRICVCGGRSYSDATTLRKTLDRFLPWKDKMILVAGGASGADTLAEDWADKNGVEKDIFPADWKTHGKAAGHIRNSEMLKSGIDILYAFPGGKGTENMIKICRKKNVYIKEL
jgi:YspA, cpYpsA-related SLOG family